VIAPPTTKASAKIVTADSLYEAIALGLTAIRKSSWAEDIAENFEVGVMVRDTPVEHSIAFRKFNQWLERPGKTPKEIMTRNQRTSGNIKKELRKLRKIT
jgi:hypothetical protein